MGLSQYGGTIRTEQYKFTTQTGEEKVNEYQIAGPFEWRKHARLQEFMNTLYMERNKLTNKWEEITQEDGSTYWNPISWDTLELNTKDIARLEEAIKNGYCDYFCEGGFLWGHEFQEEQRDYYKEKDLEFVEFAKEALADGETVVYECSW